MYQLIKMLSQQEREPKIYYQPLVEDENQNEEKPKIARKGYVAIYVGEEAKRYEVPIKFLSLQSFQQIISEFQDLDSQNRQGPIKLLCSTSSFDNFLMNARRMNK